MSSGVLEIARRVTAEIEARKQARGITVADVLRIFPGARVREPQTTLRCVHCGGEMRQRLERRRHVWGCTRCGKKKSE